MVKKLPANAFELWCWRRLLRVPGTIQRSNQSILKKINPEYSLDGLMLKFQYFDYLMQSQLTGKDPDAGRDWRQEEGATEDEMVGVASLTQWTWVWANSGRWWRTGEPGMLQSMGLQRDGHDWTTELNWTDSTPSSIHGGWFQERLLQGTAETAHSIKHCTCFFLCLSVQSVSHVWLFAYIPMIKFNLQIRQRD